MKSLRGHYGPLMPEVNDMRKRLRTRTRLIERNRQTPDERLLVMSLDLIEKLDAHIRHQYPKIRMMNALIKAEHCSREGILGGIKARQIRKEILDRIHEYIVPQEKYENEV